jgi:putative DNA primase/helicase
MERSGTLGRWAIKSQNCERISAMLKLARPSLSILPDQLDADPLLLNVANGTFDIRTGRLNVHRREDLITKICRARYRPDVPAPTFQAFMHRIFRSTPTLIEYVQRAIGYAATGDVSEQAIFFLYGRGANGKTTLMDAVAYALGDHAAKADPDLLMARDGSPGHPCNIADLMGTRLAICSETAEGRRFDESRLKDLAGETRLKARRMYGEFFEFPATHKIFIYSNHRPLVRGTDHGFWRRLRVIPFVERITDEEKDPGLPAKLQAEADGILAWIVAGAVAWHANGLGAPVEVNAATLDYRAEMDSIGTFISECCIEGRNLKSYAADLYSAYKAWAASAGEHELSQKRARNEHGRTRLYVGPLWVFRPQNVGWNRP